MITQLYVFSPGSYVVADEWNANFNVLYSVSMQHKEAIADANSVIAYPTSDFSTLFNAVRGQQNSFAIAGDSITVSPECEYYKVLGSGQDLNITVQQGLNAEARVLIQLQEDRSLLPFSINYPGTTRINYGFYNYNYFRSGYYYVMIYESNGVAQVKLIWTGV